MRKNYLLPLFFVMGVACVQAQNKNKVSPAILQLLQEPCSAQAKESGAVIYLKESILTVDKNKKTTETFHIVGKILDQKSRLDYAQIPMLFGSYYEEVKVDFARSIQPDGTVLEVYPDAIMIESLPKLNGGIQYSDTHALTFSLPGLDVGVAFEYQVTIKKKRSIVEGAWFMGHSFNYLLRNLSNPSAMRFDHVIHSNFLLRLPHGEKFQYDLTVRPTAPEKKVTKDYDEYCWTLTDVNAIKVEQGMPLLEQLSPALTISSLNSWKQVDQWGTKKFQQNIFVSKIVKKTADAVTAGAGTAEEKIKRLYHFIQQEIKYISADLDRGGYTPHKPAEVLNNRYGDCKDQTTLLVYLLRAVGIEAYPALINPLGAPQQFQVPTPFFYHVITYVPHNGNELWLDPTSGVTPFPQLFFSDQGRQTFILNGNGGISKITPVSTSHENQYHFSFRVTRQGNRANLVTEFWGKGAASDEMKDRFISMNKEEVYKTFQSYILNQYQYGVVDSVVLSNMQDPDVSFDGKVYFHIDSVWIQKQYRFTYRGNARLALEFFISYARIPHPDSRHYSMTMFYPYSISGEELYEQPSFDLAKTDLPKDDQMDTKCFSCKRKFTRTGASVTAVWSFDSKPKVIPRQDYKTYYEDLNTMRTMMEWNIVFYVSIEKSYLR